MGSKKTTTTQTTTPYGPSKGGLDYSQSLATEGLKNAQEYQGRFSPQTSPFTMQGLDFLKGLSGSLPAGYGSNALDAGDYLWNKVQSGGYRPQVYDPAAAIEASVRPVVEKYSENLIPNLGAFFTSSGGYQGGNVGGVSNTAGQQLSRDFNREATQVAGEQAYQAAALNAQNMLRASELENQTIGGLPAVYAGGLSAAQIPSMLAGQTGALDESIAGRDIIEALQQNQYHNLYEAGIVGPYLDLLMGPSQAFGTTTNITKQKADPITQAIQAIAAVGSFFGGGGPGGLDAFAPGGIGTAAGGAMQRLLAPTSGAGTPITSSGSYGYSPIYYNPYALSQG